MSSLNPADGDDPTSSSCLDTALLESLFYNEMMLLEESNSSSLLSSSLFSSLTSSTSPSSSDQATATPSSLSRNPPPPRPHPSLVLSQMDPSTIAEKALLRHFGVTADTPTPAGSLSVPDPLSLQHQKYQPAAVRLPSWTGSIPGNSDDPAVLLPTPVVPPATGHRSTLAPVPATLPYAPATVAMTMPSPPNPPPPVPLYTTTTTTAVPPPPELPEAPPPPPPPQQQQEKLVSQFATLASRLGIHLPPEMIQSLLEDNNNNNNNHHHHQGGIDGASSSLEAVVRTAAAGAAGAPPSPGTTEPPSQPPAPLPPAVQELERVAEAAIAAVMTGNKRRQPNDSTGWDAPTVAAAAAAASSMFSTTTTGKGTVPTTTTTSSYSKRRKKPRLVECETKLAQLQAENEVLKRHLTTMSNQSHKLDLERQELERQMRGMLVTGATPQEMDKIVQTFSDYYSDYGRRRHQELEFHLEQLQVLANPTNFTKMGLWTLGQQSSNPKKDPIAGILQHELNITPQQGKKILEQREKIREVCTNMSEVRGRE